MNKRKRARNKGPSTEAQPHGVHRMTKALNIRNKPSSVAPNEAEAKRLAKRLEHATGHAYVARPLT